MLDGGLIEVDLPLTDRHRHVRVEQQSRIHDFCPAVPWVLNESWVTCIMSICSQAADGRVIGGRKTCGGMRCASNCGALGKQCLAATCIRVMRGNGRRSGRSKQIVHSNE